MADNPHPRDNPPVLAYSTQLVDNSTIPADTLGNQPVAQTVLIAVKDETTSSKINNIGRGKRGLPAEDVTPPDVQENIGAANVGSGLDHEIGAVFQLVPANLERSEVTVMCWQSDTSISTDGAATVWISFGDTQPGNKGEFIRPNGYWSRYTKAAVLVVVTGAPCLVTFTEVVR